MKKEPNPTPLKMTPSPRPVNPPAEEQTVKKNRFLQLTLVCGSILLLVLSQVIRAAVPAEFMVLPLVMLPIGMALFYFGSRAAEQNGLPGWLDKAVQWAAGALKISAGQVFCLLFGLLFAILAEVAAGTIGHMWSPVPAMICWALGILLAALGGFDFKVRKQKLPAAALIFGVVLFAVALFLRAYDTAHIPIVLSGDEASSGLWSLGFLKGDLDNLFIVGWFSFPAFHNFLQSISIAVFGQTTQALRLLSAFAGALTVLVVFFVGRAMYGTTTGLMAGIFLAGMHFHLHFSRIGLNNIWDGFFLILTLGFLWLGWQRKSRAAYLVAGIGLGFSQYFYSSSHTLLLIIPLWLLVVGLMDRRHFKEALPDLFLMCWSALMVLLPLIWYYLLRPDDLVAPLNRVGVIANLHTIAATHSVGYAVWVLIQQIWTGLMAYMGTPLRAWYTPGVPILRTIPGVIFLLGVVFMLLKPKDSRNQMISLWLLVFAVIGGLSESTPAAQRYVASAPAVALMVAFSLEEVGELFKGFLPKGRRWIEVSLLVVILALAVDDAHFYFKVYTPTSDFSGFNGMVAQKLANFLKDKPAGTDVVFTGYPSMGYDSIASLPYLAPQIKFHNMNQPWGTTEVPSLNSKQQFFVFLPDHEADEAAMEAQFPNGGWTEFYTADGKSLFSLYEYDRK